MTLIYAPCTGRLYASQRGLFTSLLLLLSHMAMFVNLDKWRYRQMRLQKKVEYVSLEDVDLNLNSSG